MEYPHQHPRLSIQVCRVAHDQLRQRGRIWLVVRLAIILAIAVSCFTVFTSPAYAVDQPTPADEVVFQAVDKPASLGRLPALREFIHKVRDGQREHLVGVYVPGLMAFPIVQQPKEQYGYVADQPDVVTQFKLAALYDTIGLLAHNDQAGEAFFRLTKGSKIILVYGDGALEAYSVTHIGHYQALTPNSPYSNFINLDKEGERLSAEKLFFQTYGVGDRLILQTCLSTEDEPAWGRLFVTAVPYRGPLALGTLDNGRAARISRWVLFS